MLDEEIMLDKLLNRYRYHIFYDLNVLTEIYMLIYSLIIIHKSIMLINKYYSSLKNNV